ncbi:MAG: xanthine dehydrogenase family protein molybdopterin-binding subunit [Pseudomonadota bacterium]
MTDNARPLSVFDRPNSYVGKSVPRPNADRLVAGRGRFVDDIVLPRMLHAAFVRSPHAHAKITSIDNSAAKEAPGVVAVYTASDLLAQCEPWTGTLQHLAGMQSPPQSPLALDVARWQGEPIVLIVASSRATAEDAAELVLIDYEELPIVADSETALDPSTPLIHEDLESNLVWKRTVDAGDVDAAFSDPDARVVEETFVFGRHTGVTLEPRSTVADYDPASDQLTVYYSGQAPHMVQAILARHVGVPESNIRVISQDVGGSFGIKIHTYGDDMAAIVAAKALGRPVKYIADRLESFVTDIHARDHRVNARMAVTADGKITALAFEDRTGVGPFSAYPRTSAIEANQVLNLTGGPYRIENYRALGEVVFQNKNMMSQYRAVGHPIACAVAEGLVEQAAEAIGMDSVELRRRNIVPDDGYPCSSAAGVKFNELSHQAALEKLIGLMDLDRLRGEQAELRARGVYRGIGIAQFIELTNPSPMFYGIGGAPIAAQDGATVRLDPSGAIHVATSVTEQGQGTDTVMAQVAASAFGVLLDQVKVTTGDTGAVPYGGGTWGSRGAGIGGEAVYRAARALRDNVLEIAASILQAKPSELEIADGQVVDAEGGSRGIALHELAKMVYYRGTELPNELEPELVATRHFRVTDYPFVFTNGCQASYLEVDVDTGFVRLLNHWVVEDCGRVINPQLVDEQIRGGVVQGIGGALFEECLYSADGQMLNANMADYLVPMAAEMPDITVAHVETPTSTSELGAKGAGEAGTAGAPAAIMNAVNDALKPFGTSLATFPMTPQRILRALRRV